MGIVYFLKAKDKHLFKIGMTKGDVDKRLKAIKTGSSYQLEVYKTIETELHSTMEK